MSFSRESIVGAQIVIFMSIHNLKKMLKGASSLFLAPSRMCDKTQEPVPFVERARIAHNENIKTPKKSGAIPYPIADGVQ
jgi:hypothetical protein